MAYGYSPPYPNIYQPAFYPQPMQPQNQMLQNPQQLPMQNQQPQPMQQQAQTQQMQPPGLQQSNGMIWINGKSEADSWPVLPGNAVALWDSNAPTVYLRQADATGKPSTKVYDLVERTDERPAQKQPTEIDMSKYMTVDKAEEMINQIVSDALAERLKRPARLAKTKEDTTDG